LNIDLKELGLTTFIPYNWDKNGNSFCIDTIYQKENSGYYSDDSIKLSYQLKSKAISFESRIPSIPQKSKEYKIGCYVTPNNETLYSNIEEFAEDKPIIEKIKRLINK